MPLPGTPHVARITLGWTYETTGNQCENVFYLQDSSDAMFADPTLTCNLIWAAVASQIVPHASPAVHYNSVGLEDVRTVPFGGLVVPQTNTPGADGSTGAAIPATVALAIKKSTNNLGRSGRGRWYWPIGDITPLVTGDTVSAAYAAGVASTLADFQTAVETALTPALFGIVSYFTGGVARPAGLFEEVTGWGVTNLVVDTQTRRGIGRGK
jgi:hypothetical protein